LSAPSDTLEQTIHALMGNSSDSDSIMSLIHEFREYLADIKGEQKRQVDKLLAELDRKNQIIASQS
jgi:hypothetical protein